MTLEARKINKLHTNPVQKICRFYFIKYRSNIEKGKYSTLTQVNLETNKPSCTYALKNNLRNLCKQQFEPNWWQIQIATTKAATAIFQWTTKPFSDPYHQQWKASNITGNDQTQNKVNTKDEANTIEKKNKATRKESKLTGQNNATDHSETAATLVQQNKDLISKSRPAPSQIESYIRRATRNFSGQERFL